MRAKDDRLTSEAIGLFHYFFGDLAGVNQQVFEATCELGMMFNFLFEKGAKLLFHTLQSGDGFFFDNIILGFVKIVCQRFGRLNRSLADNVDKQNAGISLAGQIHGTFI